MNDFLKLITPKRLLLIIVEIIAYSFKVVVRCWWMVLPIFGVLVLVIVYFLGIKEFFKIENFWLILGIMAISIIPAFNYLFHKENKIRVANDSINIGISECINIQESDFLFVNLDTQRLTNSIGREIRSLNEGAYPFRTGLLNCAIVKKNKLFYLIHDLKNIEKDYQSLISQNNFQSILLILRDTKYDKIDFHFLFHPNRYTYKKPFYEFENTFSTTLVTPSDYDQYILYAVKVFASVHGLSMMDLMIEKRDLRLAHMVIDDCERLFKNSMNEIKKRNPISNHQAQIIYEKVCLCEFERYRAIIYLNQEEYKAAIRHLFHAIKINPYHPYRNYDEYRDAFNKQYAAGVASKTAAIKEELNDEGKTDEEIEKEKMDLLIKSAELLSRVEYANTPSFEDTLKFILQKSNSPEINDLVERKLKSSFCESPVQELIRGEMLKYLPKGKKKQDLLYIERIPEVLNEFRKVLDIDSQFLLMYTRIGVLLLIQAMHERLKTKAKIKLEEGIQMWKEGMDMFTRLGLDLRSKFPID